MPLRSFWNCFKVHLKVDFKMPFTIRLQNVLLHVAFKVEFQTRLKMSFKVRVQTIPSKTEYVFPSKFGVSFSFKLESKHVLSGSCFNLSFKGRLTHCLYTSIFNFPLLFGFERSFHFRFVQLDFKIPFKSWFYSFL